MNQGGWDTRSILSHPMKTEIVFGLEGSYFLTLERGRCFVPAFDSYEKEKRAAHRLAGEPCCCWSESHKDAARVCKATLQPVLDLNTGYN